MGDIMTYAEFKRTAQRALFDDYQRGYEPNRFVGTNYMVQAAFNHAANIVKSYAAEEARAAAGQAMVMAAAQISAASDVTYAEALKGIKQTMNYNNLFPAEENEVDARIREEMRKREVDAEVERRLEMIDEFGLGDFEDGTVFSFKKMFEVKPGSVAYQYVALKANDKWYLTGGKAPQGMNWTEFVTWLVSGPVPTPWENLQRLQSPEDANQAYRDGHHFGWQAAKNDINPADDPDATRVMPTVERPRTLGDKFREATGHDLNEHPQ